MDMESRWALPLTLLGGTLAMRDAGSTYLPKEEEEKGYEARLGRSYLFPAFEDTVERLVTRPFRRNPTIKGAIPTPLQPLEADVDLAGTNLTKFAYTQLEDMAIFGKCHWIVDVPAVGKDLTMAEEKDQGVRPYFTRLDPSKVFSWRSEILNGTRTLTQLRYTDDRMVSDGAWGEKEEKAIVVWTQDNMTRIVKRDDEWVSEAPVEHTFGEIPLVTVYAKKTGFMECLPPLEQLAWLNLAHWQSNSDQRNILRVARVGILYLFGITDDEVGEKLVIGPSNFVKSANSEAKMGYAEHSGAAIGAGRQDLLDLKDEMEILGLQPLVRKTGTTTAYERQQYEGRSRSLLETWVRNLEEGLTKAYQMAAKYTKTTLGDEFKVDIFNDLTIDGAFNRDEVLSLLEAYEKGTITGETLLTELRRRSLLAEDTDVIQEAKDAAKQHAVQTED